MFTVASDLSEKPERTTPEFSFFSSDGPLLFTHSRRVKRKHFEELFCRWKAHLRRDITVCTERFIIEDGFEEESAYWATDEETGEQGYVGDN